MTLKKLIAGYRDAEGNWVEQKEVDMHPLEEAEILAHWAIGDHLALKPNELTDSEKLNILLEQGQPALMALVQQYNLDLEAWNAAHAPLVQAYEEASQAYFNYQNSL